MRVLLIEDEAEAAGAAADALTQAGAHVVRCHEPGTSFPCSGMPDQDGCPIDQAPVDVALSVRRSPGEPTVAEDGVRCALRNHIPLVAAGATGGAPWLGMATAVLADGEDVVAALRAAADSPLARHGDLATEALRDVLVRNELEAAGAVAEVTRREGGVRVELRPGVELSRSVADAAAVRVAAAMRGFDSRSGSVDVVLES